MFNSVLLLIPPTYPNFGRLRKSCDTQSISATQEIADDSPNHGGQYGSDHLYLIELYIFHESPILETVAHL